MGETRRGRPRSAAVNDAILAAARTLVVEIGYGDVSMDRVAALAGVGKQTVYRRWPSKAPLIADAVIDAYLAAGSFELPDTGDIARDLSTFLHGAAVLIATPDSVALLRALAAAAADDPGDRDTLYRQLTQPHHEKIVQRLESGVAAGSVRADIDCDVIADALVGAILYRMLTSAATVQETTERFGRLVIGLLAGLTP
jgi:AcrR family transcriptional regulator